MQWRHFSATLIPPRCGSDARQHCQRYRATGYHRAKRSGRRIGIDAPGDHDPSMASRRGARCDHGWRQGGRHRTAPASALSAPASSTTIREEPVVGETRPEYRGHQRPKRSVPSGDQACEPAASLEMLASSGWRTQDPSAILHRPWASKLTAYHGETVAPRTYPYTTLRVGRGRIIRHAFRIRLNYGRCSADQNRSGRGTAQAQQARQEPERARRRGPSGSHNRLIARRCNPSAPATVGERCALHRSPPSPVATFAAARPARTSPVDPDAGAPPAGGRPKAPPLAITATAGQTPGDVSAITQAGATAWN